MWNPATASTDVLESGALRVGSCQRLEKICARTCRSLYELIILDGDAGDVLVRGGQKFPEFRRVWFAGATAGGSALKMNSIDVGLRMEFHTGDSIVVTSPVVALSRHAEPARQAVGEFLN